MPTSCSRVAVGPSAAKFLRAEPVPTASTYGRVSPWRISAGEGSIPGVNRCSTPAGITATRSGLMPSSAVSSRRENSDTVITRRARRAICGRSRRW